MIAVTGASGQLGRLVIESLLSKTSSENIVALVREPNSIPEFVAKGIEIRQADYNDPASLVKALKGIDKVLLISSNAVGQRTSQHKAVIDAAVQTGVNFLAYTSLLKADTSPIFLAKEHKETETLIKESGLNYSFLRNGWYTENYTMGIAQAIEDKAVYNCAGQGRLTTAPRAEYAEAAAVILTDETDQHLNQTYELGGDTPYDLSNFADEIAKSAGTDISYINLKEDDFKSALIEAGVPEGFAGALADAGIGIADGWLVDEKQDPFKNYRAYNDTYETICFGSGSSFIENFEAKRQEILPAFFYFIL
ncbi:SDR family oxidoreductase [Curvivirga aplysinae]|uniref:SDR family oxidoreductase n=1 Tax=Curvivirga aplysinae TaxID=2529852 RepID=UPI001C3FEBB8|nr:SDR family oxidoreductase [Curvivirga aplysinae]